MAEAVILFDIDGTLLSSAGAGKAALEKALTAHFGVDKTVDGISLSGRTDRAIIEDLFRLHGIPNNPQNYDGMKQGYLSYLPNCLALVAGKVLPGIKDLLRILCQRSDCAVGLLTGNFRDGAKIKLGHYQIEPFFAFGGFGDNHSDRDDVAREAFIEVQGRFTGGISPDRIWVVGDTPLDIQCARAIGAKVAAVATGWHSLEELEAFAPDLLLADLADPGHFLSNALPI